MKVRKKNSLPSRSASLYRYHCQWVQVEQGISVRPPSQRRDYSVTTFTKVRLHVKRRVSASTAGCSFWGYLRINCRWCGVAQGFREERNFRIDDAAHPPGSTRMEPVSLVGSVLHPLYAHGHQLHSNGYGEVKTANSDGGVCSSNRHRRPAALSWGFNSWILALRFPLQPTRLVK